jgi:hypothetical protein
MQEIGGGGVASNEKSSNLGLGTFFNDHKKLQL